MKIKEFTEKNSVCNYRLNKRRCIIRNTGWTNFKNIFFFDGIREKKMVGHKLRN